MKQISWNEFEQVELRSGTIIDVQDFPEARKPAYKLQVDLVQKLESKNQVRKSQRCIQKKNYLENKLWQ